MALYQQGIDLATGALYPLQSWLLDRHRLCCRCGATIRSRFASQDAMEAQILWWSGGPDAVSEPAAADQQLDAERLRLVCRAVVRTPLGVLPATGFIAYIMTTFPYAGAALAWGWMAVAVAIWSARVAVCAVLLRRPPPPERVGPWIRFQIAAAMLGGHGGRRRCAPVPRRAGARIR